MTRQFTLIFTILLGFLPLFSQSNSDSSATALIEFEMKDQFNREYTHESWGDSIIVVFGSDRDGSEFNRIWGEAIQDSLKNEPGFDKVRYVAVADLRGVPFFLKGLVKGFFPKENRKMWILLDWKGRFAEAYHFVKGKSNILIFNRRQQMMRHFAVTEMNPEQLPEILATLRSQLKDKLGKDKG
ncbi:MAG: hypothetical protein R3C41_13655 [Calditrichia bacterium]